MSYQMVVVAGPDQGRVLQVHAGADLMLGRSAQAYYQISDPRVSRNHCQVLLEGDRVTVLDHGGSGGTLVNGKPVKSQVLKLGDVLLVGDTQLRLEVGDLPLAVAQQRMQQAGAAGPSAISSDFPGPFRDSLRLACWPGGRPRR